MKIKFSEIGHWRKTWESEHDGELNYDWLYKQVKKNAYVMSENLNFIENENGGTILAGLHTIGKFEKITSATK